MESMSKIIEAEITSMPKSLFDPMPKVIATFDDGTKKELFSYYPDEISFTKHEFIGRTEQEAYNLRGKKDRVYLGELS
jgi:hypothetical protein